MLDATLKWKLRKKWELHATRLPMTASFSLKWSPKMVSWQNGEPLEKRTWCMYRHGCRAVLGGCQNLSCGDNADGEGGRRNIDGSLVPVKQDVGCLQVTTS